jgi:hypothetical protein
VGHGEPSNTPSFLSTAIKRIEVDIVDWNDLGVRYLPMLDQHKVSIWRNHTYDSSIRIFPVDRRDGAQFLDIRIREDVVGVRPYNNMLPSDDIFSQQECKSDKPP